MLARKLTAVEKRVFRFLFLRRPEARGNKKLIMEELNASEYFMGIHWEEIKNI